MSPIVLHESAVKPFCFYLDGNLCKGVSHRNRLYYLVETLDVGEVERVRSLCLDLRRQKLTCLVTKSERYYRVWTDLRAMQVMPDLSKPVLPVTIPLGSRPGLTKTGELAVLSDTLD